MSTINAAAPATPQTNGNDASGYFPQQQEQHPAGAGAETPPDSLGGLDAVHDGRPLAPYSTRPAKFTEQWDASQRGSSIIEGPVPGNMQRSTSYSGHQSPITGDGALSLSRGNTLRKKSSLRRSASLKRSGSRRSMKAGSVRSLALQSSTDQDELHSAFYCPVPTAANPTEALASRFQAWRKILKDLITYFRELQTHHEHRAKSLMKLANVLNNTATPPGFLASGGLDDAWQILRGYNKQAVAESNKAREIEEDVILALTGLRSDLHQKIKEIKNLAGDFKNSVEKEMDTTRRAVNQLQEVLGLTELDSSLTTGKQDPYLLRLAVDRQLERQIDEENYLHQAYLNLENSGRELESIVVGEIQKAYNAYAGILKRESDAAYNAIEELRTGPVSMPKDREWTSFIHRDDRFVNPDLPMRSADSIHYPGRDHYACQEVRAGLLERKSKYLKSYTPGWYVLSPTHLHEFKSADKAQAPVMSLYLPEQKLGSHSTEGSSSNKFVLKGRQTGTMHRGHTWVFRAESFDTMMAWYDDIKTLTERTPEERSNLVRGNSRSISRSSQRSSLDIDDDEEPPFTATVASVGQVPKQDGVPRRPSGGRFPSDLQVNAQRGLQVPVSPLSANSGYGEGLNHHDPFISGALPSRPHSDEQAHDPQGADQVRAADRDYSHRAPAAGDPAGRLGQFSSSAVPPAAGGLSLQEPGHAGNATSVGQNPSPIDFGNDGPVWAEPVPIPVPMCNKYQRLSSARESVASSAYNAQDAEAANGDRNLNMTEMGTSHGESVHPSLGDSATRDGTPARQGVAVRPDSVPTISNLHIPGEYPKGLAAG